MDSEKGFTLIEVLASLVIISIVLTSFMGIFANTNKLAVSNSEKLVVINLADSYMERFKVAQEDTINIDRLEDNKISFPPTLKNCPVSGKTENKCETITLYKPAKINTKEYSVEFYISQDKGEKNLSLFNVVVEVRAVDSNISSKVEGYVTDVKKITE